MPNCHRNPLLNNAADLKKKVDAYFDDCEKSKKVYELKNGDIKIRQTFPSMAGLSIWLNIDRNTLYSYMNEEPKAQLDEDEQKAISNTLIYARERIKQSLVQCSMSGDADPRISGMLLNAMGETTPEPQATINVIIQGDSEAYSV